MISCYVIDDEFHAIETLSDIITSTPGLELIGTSTNPLVGLEFITSVKEPDLTFVDINMPQLSGMEFASLVNRLTTIIFTTAYNNFAVEAFEKEAFDYLLKPITMERFLKCITKYRKKNKPAEQLTEDHFYIQGNVKGKMIRVNINEIIYIEGALNYIIIHFSEGERQITYLTMGEIENYLKEKDFSRIHRSFIINNNKIQSINGNEIILQDKTVLNIGQAYKTLFFEDLHKKTIKTKRTS